jgi:hypothetical protein
VVVSTMDLVGWLGKQLEGADADLGELGLGLCRR